MTRRVVLAAAFAVAIVIALLAGFAAGRWVRPETIQTPAAAIAPTPAAAAASDAGATTVSAHNLLLRKGPDFRVYVRWLRGQMAQAKRGVNPNFDDPDSFYLNIETGVLRANIGDIGNYLNSGSMAESPLRNVKLSGDGDQIKLSGTIRKGIALPVELAGTVAATTDNRIHVHVTKLNVLKVPFKGLLGLFHVTLADLFHDPRLPGLEVAANDLYFDTQKLLPPPHIRGQLTKVRVANPDLEEVYGNGQEASEKVEEWRNFLRLKEGTIDFGKLTMHHVDLIMIDVSKDAWFDLDLTHYQDQLVNGYTRMTPQAGLQIFMPDRRDLPPSQGNQSVSIEWLKNRNLTPPASVTRK